VESDPRWVRPYLSIILCYLLSYVTIQLAYPFVSLYFRELAETEAAAIAWTGATNASLPLLIGLASAVWGNLGDRVGLKLMAIRAIVVASVVFFLTSLTTQPWHVFALFVFYGATGSPPPAFSVLAAATLPASRASLGMGLLQTMQFVGVSVGPLLGVLSLHWGGFRGSFQVAAAIMACTLVVTLLFVRDPVSTRRRGRPRLSLPEGLRRVARAPRVRSPMMAMLAFNAATAAGNTLVPLYVQRMAGGGVQAVGSVGLVLAATGLGTALGSLGLAWCSDRFGPGRVALASLLLAGAGSVTGFWITDVWTLAVTRFAVGFLCGGVLPALQSVLIAAAAREPAMASYVGTVQGISQTAVWGGSALGAGLVAVVVSRTSLPVMFIVSSTLLLVAAVWWYRESRAVRRPSDAGA
jgi:MFS family permease